MNFKTVALTIFFAIGISIQSCSEECDCCFTEEYKAFFDIQDLQVKHTSDGFNTISTPEIAFEDYEYLNLHFIVEYVVEQSTRYQFSLMNTAYACSPIPPGAEGAKKESITSFEISTVNDFDQDHMAGASINDLLMIDFTEFGITFELEENPVALNTFLSDFTGNVPNEYFPLRLMKAPELNKGFQVDVRITLSNGEIYEVTSDSITFL